MSASRRKTPRPRGTGSLYVEHGSWYATWWAGGRQIKRKVGPLRKPGTRDGMTKTQAEAKLRELIALTGPASPHERLSLTEAGRRYLQHLEQLKRRKPSTLQDYTIMLVSHFEPIFGNKDIRKITDEDVLAYMRNKSREGSLRPVVRPGPPPGLSPKTIDNHLTFLGGIFRYAIKRGWATANPVAALDRAPAAGGEIDIRFLDLAELDAVIRATTDDDLGKMDGVLYLAAATTGLRQGELIALRWRDVDWRAGSQEHDINPSSADVRPSRHRTRASLPAVTVPSRRRARVRTPAHGISLRAINDPHPLLSSAQPGRCGSASLPRSPPHVRDAHGRIRRADANLQEWMGHASLKTTEIYAHYAPQPQEQEWVERAFGRADDEPDQAGTPGEQDAAAEGERDAEGGLAS